MKRWMAAVCAGVLLALSGCARYEPVGVFDESVETVSLGDEGGNGELVPGMNVDGGQGENGARAGTGGQLSDSFGAGAKAQAGAGSQAQGGGNRTPIAISTISRPEPVKVKGIYISAYVAGTESMMDSILDQMEGTQLNSVVIDFKDDEGRITCSIDSPLVNEIGASRVLIQDMPGLIQKLKDRGIYPIARVVAFRDPYLAEQKPEWSLHKADGSIYRDRSGLAWVNPYRKEVWDYLVDVGKMAGELGFSEVQFDYIRFSVDNTVADVVFDPEDTQGRSKTEAITQFMDYAYDELAKAGLYVSADVFGTIIRSTQDARSVGQDYGEMAANVDYICPMIYPSHYSSGSFGIEHPDTQPYDTIYQALLGSKEALEEAKEEKVGRQAIVRPWLQDFTASYLDHYISYGDEEVQAQIQAVQDAGYEEWLLWDAGVSYHYGGAA